ncbi:MAG: polyprenyl synthetase family protein [Bacteroidetes bacterium]|nr:MAG: polyprenyl synthetase family protein [Bacteroidota bacterium]
MHSLASLLSKLTTYSSQNPFPATPAELYEPCDYILTLGGKRLRPALLLMACELFSDEVEPALPAAWAVELFHNFSLMHDDIMDAAPLRRGKPTVHTRWNTTTGILSGDVMLIYAYKSLAAAGAPDLVARLVEIFNRVAIEVCEGQQYDMNFESREDVALEEYIRMIELKTAVLLGGALEMGAWCGGAGAADAAALYQFGRLAGIAFQIQDDLLDTYGDPEKFGKQVGGDILQNKKTFLVLKALEVASAADQHELRNWMNTDAESAGKVAAVRALFDRNDVPALVAAEKARFQSEAFRYLDQVQVAPERKTVLRKMVEALFVREF